MAKVKSALATAIATKRAFLKTVKAELAALTIEYAKERREVKVAKQAAATARKAKAIEKAKAKLEKLMAPVGAKAIKANRKPSAVIVTKG